MSGFSVRGEIVSSISHLIGADDGDDDADPEALGAGLSDHDEGSDIGGGGVDEFAAGDLEDFFALTVVDDYERISDDEDEAPPPPQTGFSEMNETDVAVQSEASSVADCPPGTSPAVYLKNLKILEHAKRSLPAYDGSVLLAPSKRRKLQSGQHSVPLDRIRGPVYGPHDWITMRGAASLVYDDNARARQTILKLVLPFSSSTPPPRGMRRVIVPPDSLTDVHFEQWQLLTTPELYTINVVSTFHLGSPIALHRFAQRLLGVAYSPLSFSALKLRDRLATYMIFLSGRVVCAGANSRMAAIIACQSLVTMLKRCDVMAECLNVSEQNDVATATAGFDINLVELARAYPLNVYYAPSCFPGAMMRFMSSQLVFIIFKRGKCIITGVASRLDSVVAWRWLHSNILWQFELRTEKYYYNEADYSRKERQHDSVIESVCQSICDVTKSAVESVLKRSERGEGKLDRAAVERVYADHLAPPQHPASVCLLEQVVVDDDDDDKDDKSAIVPTIKRRRFSQPDSPVLSGAPAYFQNVVTLCETLGTDTSSTTTTAALKRSQTQSSDVIDVEQWLANYEAEHGTASTSTAVPRVSDDLHNL